MANIVLVWELGSGLGHALPLRQLADQLESRGHRVAVVARDLLKMRAAFAGSGHRVLPAPFFPGLCLPAPQLSSLADVLWFDSGGHSAETIAAQFANWQQILELLAADLLIADAAPMTLAACQGRVPTLNYDGYFHATDASAWRLFRDWERSDRVGSEQRAAQLLAHLNSARRQSGMADAAQLHEGFAATRQLLRCLPELDPFGPREGVGYLGHATIAGAAPAWPAHSDRRVFVYLRRDYAHADRLLGALARLPDCAVICVHDGLDPARIGKCPGVHFTEQTLDLAQVLPQCDLVICHGGALHGLATQAGKPSLLMPLHTEHYLTGRMAVQRGTSLLVMPPLTSADFLTPLRRLLLEDSFARASAGIAAAHRQRVPDRQARLHQEIETLLG
jgi:hypothetical protein